METITIKNVKIAESLSEETIAFTATVYENGKRIGEAKNNGHGGNTSAYLDNPRSKTMDEESALEERVDELVYDIYNLKQRDKINQKVVRDCAKYICVGQITEYGASYWSQGFKPARPLAEIAAKPNGLAAIQQMYDRIKGELKGDEQILNRNLEARGVKL